MSKAQNSNQTPSPQAPKMECLNACEWSGQPRLCSAPSDSTRRWPLDRLGRVDEERFDDHVVLQRPRGRAVCNLVGQRVDGHLELGAPGVAEAIGRDFFGSGSAGDGPGTHVDLIRGDVLVLADRGAEDGLEDAEDLVEGGTVADDQHSVPCAWRRSIVLLVRRSSRHAQTEVLRVREVLQRDFDGVAFVVQEV